MTANDEATRNIELLHSRVRTLLNDTVPENLIIEELLKDGHNEYYARTVIDNIRKEKKDAKSFNKTLSLGLFITIGGILINIFSYQSSETNGSSSFYIFWGIVAVGISLILKAFVIHKK